MVGNPLDTDEPTSATRRPEFNELRLVDLGHAITPRFLIREDARRTVRDGAIDQVGQLRERDLPLT
jgi:hypothetical protein